MLSEFFLTSETRAWVIQTCLAYAYEPSLVVLSGLVAIFASYTAFKLASRVSAAKTARAKAGWLATGSASMGIGIWSMHFIAMLAVSLPTEVQYHTGLTALSIVFALAGSTAALTIVSRGVHSALRLLSGGVLLGGAVGAMHYTGMAAMHMSAEIRYDPVLFLISVVVAVALSCLALRLLSLSAQAGGIRNRALRGASGCVMGLSITAMHYTGMLATYFLPAAPPEGSGELFLQPGLIAPLIGGAAILLIGMALIAAVADHRLESAVNRVRQSESFLAAIVAHTADGMLVIDRTGKIQTCNPSAQRMFGYGDEELIGRNISILLPPERRQAHAAILGSADLNPYGPMGRRPVDGLRKDGTPITVEVSLSSMTTDDGRLFIGICHDVTERIRAERDRAEAANALREREAFLRAITDNLPVVIIYVNRDLQLRFANRLAETWLGLSQERLAGCRLPELVHVDDDEVKRSRLDLVLEGEEQRFDSTIDFLDGVRRNVNVVFVPDTAETGAIVGCFAIFQDFSNQRDLERQLAQAQKLEAVGQLASGIAHEINTPAQYIGDNLRFLEEAHAGLFGVLQAYDKVAEAAASAEASRETLHPTLDALRAASEAADLDYLIEEIPTSTAQSLEGIQQVSHIVQAMKDFSHRSDRMKAPVDLNKTIKDTLTITRNSWKYAAEVETDLDPDLPEITCTGAEVKQVVLNLVVNAAHAVETVNSSALGKIAISSRLADDCVEIRVSDNGTGIPKDIQDRIFDPFFTTKDVGKGTGQGLSICHDIIVNKHGGRLHFETEERAGTTFVVQLPLGQPSAMAQAAE